MNDREKLKAAFPVADAMGLEPKQWAAHSGVDVSVLTELANDDSFLAEIETEKKRAEIDGSLLTPKARSIALKALNVIASQLDDMDAFEAAEILKPMQRLLDAEDRRQAAMLDKADSLPIVHWVINGGNVTIDVIPGRPAALESETAWVSQDAPKPKLQEPMTVFKFDCVPLHIEGGSNGE
jgi:hypothetical protein